MAKGSEADIIRLRHMLDACDEIRVFTKRISEREFQTHRMLILATLKELELIGEAASKVSLSFRKKHPQVPWKTIIAMRNRLIHGYFDINLDIVWRTVHQEIPPLTKLLKAILTET